MPRLRIPHQALTAWAITIAVLAALVIGPIPAARALEGRLQFSTDGTTWTAALPRSLFDGDVVLVPGGAVSTTLHIRSTAETPGVLSTALTNVRVSDENAGKYFGVSATSDAGTGIDGTGAGLARSAVTELGTHTPIGSPLTLAPGQSAQFTLTIDLELRLDGTGAQNSDIGLDLAITFTDAAGRGEGEAAPGGTDEGGTDPQVIPALPALGDESGAEVLPIAADPAASSSPADRGFLAITGIARSLILATVVITLLGALLLGASRRSTVRS